MYLPEEQHTFKRTLTCGCMRLRWMSSSFVLGFPQWHSSVSALAPDTTDSLLSAFLAPPPTCHHSQSSSVLMNGAHSCGSAGTQIRRHLRVTCAPYRPLLVSPHPEISALHAAERHMLPETLGCDGCCTLGSPGGEAALAAAHPMLAGL